MTLVTLPGDLLLGVATAHPHVAGAAFSDQAEFGWMHARTWASRESLDPRLPKRLEPFLREPLMYTMPGIGHDDIEVAKRDFAGFRGVDAVRTSIDWSFVHVRPEAALKYYRELFRSLRAAGTKVVACLWHFTNPCDYSAMRRGWLDQSTVRAFERFVRFVVAELGDLVDIWLTMNEISGYAMRGYVQGEWMPGRKLRLDQAKTVTRNLIKGHHAAVKAVKERYPDAPVGIAQAVFPYEAWPDNAVNRRLARLYGEIGNHGVLKAVAASCDFIGVQNYGTLAVNGIPHEDHEAPADYSALYRVIAEVWERYRKPVFVTEHGTVDDEDSRRPLFIRHALANVARAHGEGIPFMGYLYFAPFDAPEWGGSGWSLPFGLVQTDPNGLRRDRPSKKLFLDIVARRAFAAPTSPQLTMSS